ncbi:MAG TPA: twin-arginine translocase TatA/TatE family subunit [Candidatus Thermoplasmatota archaeon]|nr:twin-arginine translocase TatA/TatE family subunit [Candidatus Thermoplasmatota archaeon]
MFLALLNLGPSEVALLLVLFLLLFGAQKVPDLARALGRVRAELERAQRDVRQAMRSEEERALEEQLAFERAREHQMREQDEDLQRLRRAAEEMGVQAAGLTKEELRAEMAKRLAGPEKR